MIHFNEVGETGEDESTDDNEKYQKKKLFIAVLKSVGYCLKYHKISAPTNQETPHHL